MTAQDRVKPVLCSLVCGPSIFGNIRTNPVHGPSPDEPRTGTGPDFKALPLSINFFKGPPIFLAQFFLKLNI